MANWAGAKAVLRWARNASMRCSTISEPAGFFTRHAPRPFRLIERAPLPPLRNAAAAPGLSPMFHREISVRNGVIACSLLVLSFTLTGCDSSSSQKSDVTAENARWSDATAKQLREAIDRDRKS